MQSERYELCVGGGREKCHSHGKCWPRAVGTIELHVATAEYGEEEGNFESVAIVVNYESIRKTKNRPRLTKISFNRVVIARVIVKCERCIMNIYVCTLSEILGNLLETSINYASVVTISILINIGVVE